VQRGWRQPETLGTERHGRVIDRLHVDPVVVQELVGGGFAQPRVATITGTMWLGNGIIGRPASARRRFSLAVRSWWRSRSMLLFLDDGWQRARWRARAGGSEVVKKNPGEWLRRKSRSAAEPAT
jgi:hypothetical protein